MDSPTDPNRPRPGPARETDAAISRRRRALRIASALPEGYARVRYRGRLYGLTVRRGGDGRSVGLLAESLDGRDTVSANLYRLASRLVLRPCEMPEEKVVRFLTGFERVTDPARPDREAVRADREAR